MSRFADPDAAVEYARSQWHEGERRLDAVAPDSHRRDVLEEVVDAIMVELERRVGQSFTSEDLVTAAEDSERWCLEIAHRIAPEEPYAWDLDIVQAAAFHRFARRAQDYQL